MRSATLSRRMNRIKASAIREILKVTERPDILSFAGGLPAPEAFPIAELARAHAETFDREGAAALQYSTTEGFAPLRAWIAERMRKRGLAATPEQVLITTGSQQGIDLVAKVLLDPGDTVVVENPSYLAALQAFQAYEARLAVVSSDEQVMLITEKGMIIRLNTAEISTIGRNTQGVRLIQLEEGDHLVSVARLAEREDGDEGAPPRPEGPADGKEEA